MGCPFRLSPIEEHNLSYLLARALCKQLGIRQALSTAIHLQTDGPTERDNAILEDMLRHYVNCAQDWPV